MHFCTKAQHCFSYYVFDSNNIVCEVEALGEVQVHEQDSKVCTNILKVGRRLTWQEVLVVANDGINNTGHSNSGDQNSGYRNSGAFCLDSDPKLYLFDKITKMTIRQWEQSKAVDIMNRLLEITIWVYASSMTAEEKQKYPKYETTGGYLKTKSLKEAWEDMWGNLSEQNRKVFVDLENFDADKFFEITGVRV